MRFTARIRIRPVPKRKYPDIKGDPTEDTQVFEDLWSSRDDYDMDDVVIKYSTTFITDKSNNLLAIEDVFILLNRGIA